MSELARDTKMLLEIVCDIDNACRHFEDDVDTGLICFSVMEEARRRLKDASERLQNELAPAMRGNRQIVMGAGTFQRHSKRDGPTYCIDDAGLWRAVLDSRLVVRETGEILPQHELILRVYGTRSKETGKVRLNGASPTKLEAVGLDADMFFDKRHRVGWTIQQVG